MRPGNVLLFNTKHEDGCQKFFSHRIPRLHTIQLPEPCLGTSLLLLRRPAIVTNVNNILDDLLSAAILALLDWFAFLGKLVPADATLATVAGIIAHFRGGIFGSACVLFLDWRLCEKLQGKEPSSIVCVLRLMFWVFLGFGFREVKVCLCESSRCGIYNFWAAKTDCPLSVHFLFCP